MLQNIKKVGCIIIIIILLPYVLTVFINGSQGKVSGNHDKEQVRVRTSSGIVDMPLKDYALGVLARELPEDYAEEAAKAQAILVRTGIYKKIHEDGQQAVFEERFWTEREMEKNWGGRYKLKFESMSAAWEATNEQVITYKKTLAMTPFHQLSNGTTRDGKEVLGSKDYPYLKKKDCPKDVEAEDQMEIKVINIEDLKIAGTDSTGYVLSVKCGKETMTGEEFRKTYGLKSSCFTVQKYQGKLRITTKGIGHGLGLSQYTANEMAKEGKTCEEILQYFFTDTKLEEVSQFLAKAE